MEKIDQLTKECDSLIAERDATEEKLKLQHEKYVCVQSVYIHIHLLPDEWEDQSNPVL